MWKYIKRYLPYGILAAVFMVAEVLMDLLQPEIMSRIVDDGVLGVSSNGVGDMGLIWTLGLKMICLVLLGGFSGSLNNAFVHMTGQNVGNEMRKDAFRKLMTFSFPQVDRFGAGSLVTRVTNDITQVQNLVSQFVRGMIRTGMLMFGSIFFLFRLNTRFGLIVLCAFPLIVGCLALCLSKANPLFSRLQAQLDRINAILQEDISGIRIIKACIRESYEKLRFGKANGDLIQTQGIINNILRLVGLGPYNFVNVGSSWRANMLVVCIYIVWKAIPFKILVLLGGLQNVNKQYYEAAKIDGTSKIRTFFRITVPMVSPMLAYVIITSFIGGFKEYSSIVGIFGEGLGPGGNGQMNTIVGYVYNMLPKSNLGNASAASLILFAIILVVTAINGYVSKKKVHY